LAATLATEPKEQVHYLLNDLQQNNMPYIPSMERTIEDDKALTWNAKLFESTKRTHCNAERFEAIFKETMTYITTTEHHMYMDIQKGLTTEREFVAWLRSYFNRTYPEMRNDNDFSIMYERLHTAVFQYYVLQPLIDHDDTSDIKVCAPDDIRVRVKGKAYKSTCNFLSVNDLYQFIEGLALRNGLDFSHPEITFTDSHDEHYILRFLISAPAVNAVDYPYLHIRKVPKDKPDFDKLIKDEMLTPMVMEYLKDRIKTSKGIVISGPPGSGKSTLLNAGLEVIPKTRETLVIQENDELHTKQSGFMFKHVTHGFHGEPVITLEELGKMALVEGCNEFIIGEVKGGEMRYAATLMRSGGYCMYTTHSLSARETLPRCADLVKQGSDYSYEDACKMLKNVETVVFMEDYQVQEILEVKGFDVTTQEFIYRPIYRNPHPRYAADSGDFGTVNSSKGEGLAATQQGEGKDVGKDGIFIYPKKEESIYSSGGTPSEHRSSPPPSPLNGAKSSLNHQTDDSAIPDFSSILSE